MKPTAFAWVPDNDPERDWSTAAGLAIRWVEHRCTVERLPAVLVTNAKNSLGVRELDRFAERHQHTTRRSGRLLVKRTQGPVLAYVPYAEDLDYAVGLARNSSIAVVETVGFPIFGWASWHSAVDLLTGEETEPLPAATRELVEHLKFYGNNGFGPPFDRKNATHLLDEARNAGGLDPGVVASACLGAGVSPDGIKRLLRIIDKPQR